MRNIKRILLFLGIIILLGLVTVFGIDLYVKLSTKNNIITKDKIEKDYYDCIVVLGAGLRNGKPSPILEDRLKTAIDLYNDGYASKILVSGDHGQKDYDEVNAMKDYIIEVGIPSEDIFMDHAGFSTYDSVYRVKEIFKASKVIIVTQEFHLYRSLYIANKMDLEAVGVSATLRNYTGEFGFEIREVLARDKDFAKTIFMPEPKYLGEEIPVFGDGNVTNDR